MVSNDGLLIDALCSLVLHITEHRIVRQIASDATPWKIDNVISCYSTDHLWHKHHLKYLMKSADCC